MASATRVPAGLPWAKTGCKALPELAWVEEDHDLWARFGSGNVYRFRGVPKRCYSDVMKASDKMRALRSHVMGRFDFERVSACG